MNPVLKKLRIKTPHRFLLVDAPDNFERTLDADDCTFSINPAQAFDSIHWFVRSKADLDAGFDKIMSLAQAGAPVWTYYPKGSSGIKTDLTRDKGWETLTADDSIRWLAMISFDETWTAFCFRKKTEKDLAEETKPQEERLIFQYADSKTKTIILPDDMKAMLDKHPAEKTFFDSLSFSNRREYVEWIITAKQEKTRQDRVRGMIERLGKGWKNPANR